MTMALLILCTFVVYTKEENLTFAHTGSLASQCLKKQNKTSL